MNDLDLDLDLQDHLILLIIQCKCSLDVMFVLMRRNRSSIAKFTLIMYHGMLQTPVEHKWPWPSRRLYTIIDMHILACLQNNFRIDCPSVAKCTRIMYAKKPYQTWMSLTLWYFYWLEHHWCDACPHINFWKSRSNIAKFTPVIYYCLLQSLSNNCYLDLQGHLVFKLISTLLMWCLSMQQEIDPVWRNSHE